MAATIDEIEVLIKANAANFEKELGKVKKELKELETVSKSASKGVSTSMIAMGTVVGQVITKVVSKAFSSLNNVLRESDEAYKDTSASLTKLATVMKQRGATQAQYNEVIKVTEAEERLGVVSATAQQNGLQELATYVGKAESLKQLTNVMNNLIVQQHGYNATADQALQTATMMGKVLQGQTGGMERIGYHLDEADKKLFNYGTEEERVALLAEIVNDNLGDMNRELGKTNVGKQIQLANTWSSLKAQIGELATAVKNLLLPAFSLIANAVGRAIGYIKAFFKLFGVDTGNSAGNTADSLDSAAGAMGDYGDAAEKAGKKAKKSLAAFDEMNVLTESKSDSDDDEALDILGGLVAGVEAIDWGSLIPDIELPEWIKNLGKIFDTDIARAWGEAVKKVLKTVQKDFQSIFSKVGKISSTLWENMRKSVTKYGDELNHSLAEWATAVGNCVSSAIDLAFAPIDGFLGGVQKRLEQSGQELTDAIVRISIEASNASTQIIDKVTEGINGLIEPIRNGFANLGEMFTQMWIDMTTSFAEHSPEVFGSIADLATKIIDKFNELSAFIGKIWEDTTGSLKKVWDENGKELTDNIALAIDNILKVFQSLWDNLIEPIVKPMLEALKRAWDENLKPIVEKVAEFVMKLINFALLIWNKFISPIIQWLTEKLAPTFEFIGGFIGGVISAVGAVIGSVVNGIIGTFSGIIDFLTGVFTGDWEKAWNGVKSIFENIANSLGGIIKAPINFIIDCINSFIRGLNKIKIPDWVPAVGGKGINIGEIPRLAKGGIVSQATLAVIGERGSEAIMPLENNTGWISTLASKLADEQNYNNNNPIQVVVKVGEETLIDKIVDGLNEASYMRNRAVISI